MQHRVFSLIVPVFQNRANLYSTVPRLLALAEALPGYRLELVFIDDGSTDGSSEILREFAERYPETIVMVKLTRNFGQTPAIQAGLALASGDCVGIISADLQEDPAIFETLIAEWTAGAKFVIGERCSRDEGALHRFTSGMYWSVVRRIAFSDFPSMGYDLCLLDRQVVADLNRISEKNSSIFVLIYWLGYRPVRVPVHRKIRTEGTSQWNFLRKISFTVDTIIGFSYLPARLITFTGFVTAVLSAAYLLYIAYVWWTFRSAPAGWMTVVVLVTMLGAMILFALGIVSEYVLRVLDEARKRPAYVVDTVIRTRPLELPQARLDVEYARPDKLC